MTKQTLLFIGIVLVGGAVIASALFLGKEHTGSTGNPPDAALLGDPQHRIRMTNNGFEPSEIRVRAGDVVQWINNDTVNRWPASDLHPTHGIYPAFDPQRPIAPGDSWSFQFEKMGNWKFHDHLKPLFHGIVYVE